MSFKENSRLWPGERLRTANKPLPTCQLLACQYMQCAHQRATTMIQSSAYALTMLPTVSFFVPRPRSSGSCLPDLESTALSRLAEPFIPV